MNALLSSLTLAALSAPSPAGPVGTTWTLQTVQLPGRAPITPGPALARPTLRLDTSSGALKVSGSTGCSPLTGTGTLKGQALLLRGLSGGSSMNCPDAALSLREDYLALLARTTRFEQKGNTLTLVAGAGRLTFTAGGAVNTPSSGSPSQPASLDGTYVASGLKLGPRQIPLRGVLSVTVKGPALSLGGVVGCNSLRAQGTRLPSGAFQFMGVAGTRLLCPAPQAEAEQALSAVLRGPLSPALNGTTLTLTGQAGVLTLTRLSPGAATGTPAGVPTGTYRLKTLGGQPAPQTARPVVLTFENGRVGGVDGCNSFGAPASVSGDRLTVKGGVTSTRMMCPEEQTLPLLALLEAGPTLKVAGKTLTLQAGDQVWEFEKN
ncbi:META domain-containing protein [Deinococcus aquaedulcis]|uniref:META domain-containing protein n=1 Tax=Deinococcus aquaedulcis TaxID=2840455 RepID=UPI001C834BC9|nr:META domain-containing protein [Deinococcus aquaedulcis]